MSVFNQRKDKGKELTDYLVNFLKIENIPYFESGYEFYKDYNNASEIRNLKDETSKFVRYYPDYTIVGKNKTVFIEVKNSSGIEKECFDHYNILVNNLNLDILFLCKNKKLCNVKNIVFQTMYSFDKKANMDIPITNSIWREPRKLESLQYANYLKAYAGNTSGCTFAYIDFEKTKFYEIDIIKKLV